MTNQDNEVFKNCLYDWLLQNGCGVSVNGEKITISNNRYRETSVTFYLKDTLKENMEYLSKLQVLFE